MWLDILIGLLKVLGIALTGLLGLAGLLYNHRQRGKLTRQGRWIFGGIIVSTLIGASAAIFESTKSGLESSEQAARNSKVLLELSRLMHPISDIVLHIRVKFTRGPGYEAFVRSLNEKHKPSVPFNVANDFLSLEPSDPDWPSYNEFGRAISALDGCLSASEDIDSPAVFDAPGKTQSIRLSRGQEELELDVEIAFDPKFWRRDPQIKSEVDLRNSLLRFSWCTWEHSKQGGPPILLPSGRALAEHFKIKNVVIDLSKSRYWMKEAKTFDDGVFVGIYLRIDH